jgi:hypothetical protein
VKYLSKLTLNAITNGWKEESTIDELFSIDDTIAYDEGGNSTSLLNALIGVGLANEFVTIGTRLSPSIPLSKTNKLYRINWVATIPTGTSVTIETNILLGDGTPWQGWKTVKNGAFIPDYQKTLMVYYKLNKHCKPLM